LIKEFHQTKGQSALHVRYRKRAASRQYVVRN